MKCLFLLTGKKKKAPNPVNLCKSFGVEVTEELQMNRYCNIYNACFSLRRVSKFVPNPYFPGYFKNLTFISCDDETPLIRSQAAFFHNWPIYSTSQKWTHLLIHSKLLTGTVHYCSNRKVLPLCLVLLFEWVLCPWLYFFLQCCIGMLRALTYTPPSG